MVDGGVFQQPYHPPPLNTPLVLSISIIDICVCGIRLCYDPIDLIIDIIIYYL
jgi:hypothetical protein